LSEERNIVTGIPCNGAVLIAENGQGDTSTAMGVVIILCSSQSSGDRINHPTVDVFTTELLCSGRNNSSPPGSVPLEPCEFRERDEAIQIKIPVKVQAK
jgi:hypothetical protein